MTTKKITFECKKCGYDNNVSVELEFGTDDQILSHKKKKLYVRTRFG